MPEKFKEIKQVREERIIEKLKDIRSAQEAYKSVYNVYVSTLDSLIYFMKFDSIRIVRSIGSLTDEQIEKGMTEAEAIKKGFIIRDVVKVSALENVDRFGKDYPIDDLKYVPFTKKKHQFKMGSAKFKTDSGLDLPVFEAKVSNMIIFEDLLIQYETNVLEENGERIRLKKYPGLKVGDLLEANNNVGNWE
ncbi:hypothetical protein FACS1894199_13570 [Bacteroidia bacterium]|nr:hypothetical protein FACS1894199_13570 [Bacteroidia bacterium]